MPQPWKALGGLGEMLHDWTSRVQQSDGRASNNCGAICLQACRLSLASQLPEAKQRACLIQLHLRPTTYSVELASTPTVEAMESWAKRGGVICLHDLVTIDNPWTEKLMSLTLKTQIRKALQPSKRFEVCCTCSKISDCKISILLCNGSNCWKLLLMVVTLYRTKYA